MIDFRSDTFTRPTPDMLTAMLQAPVGDDVFQEDPSVNALEKLASEMFEREAALFCPSGTMTNQIAIKVHTQPGDEVICDQLSHVYIYEGGGIAFNSGCQVKPIAGHRGRITASQITQAINPDDIHKAPTRLVSLENTANRGGGSCYKVEDITPIRELCTNKGLKLHLDGARLFNALVANEESPAAYGKLFDSVSICLSKGLGAPVGSLLIGDTDFIHKARRYRKIFGGGMRQAGFLAAAGIFALENHIDRLRTDHHHTQILAEALDKKEWVHILPPETNILIFEVKPPYTAASLKEKFLQQGIRVMDISDTQIRMVTHLDISEQMVEKTLQVIQKL